MKPTELPRPRCPLAADGCVVARGRVLQRATRQGRHSALTFRLYLLTVGGDDDAFQLFELQMFENFPQPQHKSAFGLSLDWIFLVHTILETNQLFQQVRNTSVNFFTEHLAAVAERNIRHGHVPTGCDTPVRGSWHTSDEADSVPLSRNHALRAILAKKVELLIGFYGRYGWRHPLQPQLQGTKTSGPHVPRAATPGHLSSCKNMFGESTLKKSGREGGRAP